MWNPTPLYWYKELWVQKIYGKGVENTFWRYNNKKRRSWTFDTFPEGCESTDGLIKWCCLLRMQKAEGSVPRAEVIGLRLYVKEEKGESAGFVAVVEILYDDPENTEAGRLFSCRDCRVGDIVTFFPLFEELGDGIAVGGNLVRVTESSGERNVHLTANRLLRCSKVIKKGDEIVRLRRQDGADEYFERIDRFVFNPETEVMGRIGQQRQEEESVMIEYADGSTEVATRNSGLGYGYRDNRVS